MKAYLFNENKEFVKEIQAQIDPLASKLAGENKYILPANSTFESVIEAKDGFIRKFDGVNWYYEELPVEIEEVEEPYEPTYADLRRAEYPAIGEQLDMIYWDKVNNTNLWVEKITEIKEKYPKV